MSSTKLSQGQHRTSVEKSTDFDFERRKVRNMSPQEKIAYIKQRNAEQDVNEDDRDPPNIYAEDRERKEEKQKKKKEKRTRPLSEDTSIYNLGFEYLNRPESPYQIEFDMINGLYEKHKVYKKVKPPTIPGIVNDPDFRILTPIKTLEDLSDLQYYLTELPGWIQQNRYNLVSSVGSLVGVMQEWLTIANPSGVEDKNEEDITPIVIKRCAANLKILQKDNEKTLRTAPFSTRRLFRSEDYMTRSICPLSYVPPVTAFPAALHDLTFEKLFPIFPEAECALFKLWMGRVGVGPSNQIPDGWDEPLTHTFRLGLIILGREAGVGKSWQMERIRDAMYLVGMTFESMRSTCDQFGTGRFVSADVAYKDDTSKKSVASIAASETTKQIISQGEVVVEDKYKDSTPVIPRCAVAMNTNEIDMNTVYTLDPGIIDRCKILKTRNRAELDLMLPDLYPDPSDRPGSLEPAIYIKWLAKRYGVSWECLMLWGLRQATDMFYEMIKDGDVAPMYRYHHHYANRLRLKFMPDIRISAMRAFMIAMLMTDQRIEPAIPELSPAILKRALSSYIRFQGGLANLSEVVKQDWEDADRDPKHAWQGFRDLSLPSVCDANGAFDNSFREVASASKEAVKAMNEVLAHINTRGGQKLTGGFTHLADDWNEARSQYTKIIQDVKRYKSLLPKDASDYFYQPLSVETDTGWVESIEYSPDTAEYIRPTKWSIYPPSAQS